MMGGSTKEKCKSIHNRAKNKRKQTKFVDRTKITYKRNDKKVRKWRHPFQVMGEEKSGCIYMIKYPYIIFIFIIILA